MRTATHITATILLALTLLRCGGDPAGSITPTDNTPPIAYNSTVAVEVNSSGSIILNATDDDNDLLHYRILTTPDHGSLTQSAYETWIYTPDTDYEGVDTFTFKANDGIADSNLATIALNVSVPNHAPVAQDGNNATDMNVPVDITLYATDSDGDTLTYAIVTGQEPLHGTLEQSAGTPSLWTYTPDEDYSGDDQFRFMANDGLSDSNVATVRIQVGYVNVPPDVEDLELATTEDIPIADREFNAIDDDGHPLTFTVETAPNHGVVEINSTRFTYTPDPDYYGEDSFTVTAFDGYDTSDPALISITIAEQNDQPIAHNQTLRVIKNTPLDFTLQGTDVEGQPLTYTIVTEPLEGVLERESLPNCTYTPPDDFTGIITFTYTVTDSDNLTSTPATITFAIQDMDIIFVDPDATGTADGTSWDNACTTLQDAFTVAEPGDEIWLAQGTYAPSPDSDVLATVTTPDCTLYGGFTGTEYSRVERATDPALTILNGNEQVYHVLAIAQNVTLNTLTITGGKADGSGNDGYGGALYVTADSITLQNCAINTNYAREGGGIYTAGTACTISDSNISENSAQNGGALYLAQNATATIADSTFTSNDASMNGGAIYTAPQSTLSISNSKFGTTDDNGNQSQLVGGALSVAGEATVRETVFQYNDAAIGGAIYEYTGTSSYTDCTISNNTAHQNGGGMTSVGALTLSNTKINNNTAENGGGLYLDSSGIPDTPLVLIEDTVIKDNDASSSGGGIYVTESNPEILGCTISGNDAPRGGGIACYSNGNPTISDSVNTNGLIKLNNATGGDNQGGGLYSNGSTPVIDHIDITSNTASQGGGFYFTGHTLPRITGCLITENSAVTGGALYFNEFSEATIEHSRIESNTTNGKGGAVYSSSSLPLLFNNLIVENRANDNGGAVYSDNSSVTIINCTIAKNVSHFDDEPADTSIISGGIASLDAANQIYNSILFKNLNRYIPDDEDDSPVQREIGGVGTSIFYSYIWHGSSTDGNIRGYNDGDGYSVLPAFSDEDDYKIKTSGSASLDSGLPDTEITPSTPVTAEMYMILRTMKTTNGGSNDSGIIDMGYHR